MSMLIFTLSVAIGLLLAGLVKFIIMNFLGASGKAPMIAPGQKPAITDVLSELNMLIQLECVAVIDAPQSVKQIPLINDFQEVQMEIIHNVLESLSMGFWAYCNQAGLKKSYIITYVTRRSHAEILSFMQEHNFSMDNTPIESENQTEI